MHYELHQALFSDELTVIMGWWTSGMFQKLIPKTPQLFCFTLKAAITGITFCTGVDHCAYRMMYYECPSWGCLQFHYYSLFEAFFVGFVGLLSQENMTENCGPCESSQISNLRAMISKQGVPSALPCCPVLPRERPRVQNPTQTLFMEKGKMLMRRTGYVSPNILTSTWNERKGKVIYFIFFQNQEHTIKAFMLFMSPTKGNRWLLEYHLKSAGSLTHPSAIFQWHHASCNLHHLFNSVTPIFKVWIIDW